MKNQALRSRREASAGNGIDATPTLLIVGPVEDDRGRDSLFDRLPWRTERVPNGLEAVALIRRRRPHVVVCERELADCDWKDVLEATASLPDPPPVVVTSRLADERLWAEVLNLGGYDVLAKPLDEQEVRRTLSLAWGRGVNQGNTARRSQAALGRYGDSTICLTA